MRTGADGCRECEVQDCVVKKYCAGHLQDFLSERKISIRTERGQEMVLEGTPAAGVFLLRSGSVKISKRGLNGKSVIIKLGKPGDLFGSVDGSRKETYPYSVAALQGIHCCFIEKNVFHDLLLKCADLSYGLMRYCDEQLRMYENRMCRLVQMSVREKVADTLLFMRNIFGEETPGCFVGPSLSRQELAELSGTTKEQVSKILSEFGHDQMIGIAGRQIIILRQDRLRAVAGV